LSFAPWHSSFYFLGGGEKFPAFRFLNVTNHRWSLCSEADFEIWNFSRLEVLMLSCTYLDMDQFLFFVSANDIPVLRKLSLCLTTLTSPTGQASRLARHQLLGDLIGNLKLEALIINNYNKDTLLEGIVKGGRNLRSLRLETFSQNHFSLGELETIRDAC